MARKKDFDEDALLEKATRLFWRKGYNATSAQDLVDELGINRSSIYNTYTDKRTLFKSCLNQYQQQQTNTMIAMLNKATDAEATIKEVFDRIIYESNMDNLHNGCFMVNTAVELSGHDPEISDMVNGNNKTVEDALTTLIEKGQQQGQIASKNTARVLARFIFGNITALRVTARSAADKSMMNDIATVALASLK